VYHIIRTAILYNTIIVDSGPIILCLHTIFNIRKFYGKVIYLSRCCYHDCYTVSRISCLDLSTLYCTYIFTKCIESCIRRVCSFRCVDNLNSSISIIWKCRSTLIVADNNKICWEIYIFKIRQIIGRPTLYDWCFEALKC